MEETKDKPAHSYMATLPSGVLRDLNAAQSKTSSPDYMKRATSVSPRETTWHLKKETVRKGKGITGVGTSMISPQLSGRLTLGMLQKMKKARIADAQFTGEEENELEKIKRLMSNKQNLEERRQLILKALELNNDPEIRKQLKLIEKEQVTNKHDLIMELKNSFKHITGMWPKTAKFESENERMESWQTTSVIK